MNGRKASCLVGAFLSVLVLAAPLPGWGACSEEAQAYYAKGGEVRQKYGAICPEECHEERAYFYRQAVALCPTDAKAYTNLGDALEKLGRYPEAETHYAKAIQLNPQLAVAHFSLGDLYFTTGAYAQAVQAYDSGLALDPEDALAKELRGVAVRLTNKEVLEPESLAPTEAWERERIVLPLSILFAVNDVRLLPDAKALLRQIGAAMKSILAASPSAAFLIEGHTDLRGPERYNQLLSERRARRVAEYLVKECQIPADRLGIRGYGKTRPRDPGTSEAAHARNRRVEFSRLEMEALRADPSIQPVRGPARAPLAVDVAVFRERAGSAPEKLADGAVLRSGEGYRVFFEPQQTCHVNIVQIDPAGKLFHLFPNPEYGTRDNLVHAWTASWVPGKDTWFELDQTRGTEEIYVLVSRVHRDDIADLLRRYADLGRGSRKPGVHQEMTAVWTPMKVDQVRPGQPVAVTTKQGATTLVRTDRFERAGVSLAYRFAFRHE